MPLPVTLLVTCVLVLAAWLVTHVMLVVTCVRSTELTQRDRWLSLVPPLAPWLGWRAGRKRTVIGWACLIVLYVSLRTALGVR